jgi:hypothetical protein
MLVPPQQDRSFYIYLLVGDTSITSVVVQVYDVQEKVVCLPQQEDARYGDQVPQD